LLKVRRARASLQVRARAPLLQPRVVQRLLPVAVVVAAVKAVAVVAVVVAVAGVMPARPSLLRGGRMGGHD
jgi:hypothetical protein